MKAFLTSLFCLFVLSCAAQDQKYYISPALDIRQTGCNKVLSMKNGNTLLFHFELGKKIVVTVFDSTHKQIACSRDQNRIFDLYLLESAVFKGLYDINNEAVMFFEQDMSGKPSLVRMRYNAADGSLIDEKLVGESKNENRRIKYYVMKNKEDDNYEVLFCMDKRHPKESDIFVVYFNNHHQSIKEVRLELERKKYDFLEVIGAESQPNGLFITIGLDKTMLYGGTADLNTTAFAASDHDSDLTYGSSVYQHYISCYFIPKDSTAVKQGLVDLSEGINPYYSLFTWNPLVSSVNLLLYSFKPMNYRFGLDEIYGAASSDIFFKIDQRSMAVDYTLIKNTMANDHLKQQGGKRYFEGMPVKMFTGNNGLSTVVYQSYMRDAQPETGAGYNNNDFTDHIGATNFQGSRGQSYMRDAQPEPGGRYDYEDYLGNIGITQFDDVGKEIWGTVLPLAQYYKSYRHHLTEKNISKRWQDQEIFGDLPAFVYNRQFLSFNTYTNNRCYYVIYNDYNKNFNSNLKRGSDTVYTFDNTNSFYYKVDQQKQVTKNYLFGEPGKGEYVTGFIEGAAYDEQRGVYASLVQYKKFGKTSLRMAWRTLD